MSKKIKLVVEIPEEFEEHFDLDKFENSLKRVMSDIQENGNYAGNYELEVVDMLREAIANGTPLPKGHGRLGDLDLLYSTVENMPIKGNEQWFNMLQKVCIRIAGAPTIVEADKDEQED